MFLCVHFIAEIHTNVKIIKYYSEFLKNKLFTLHTTKTILVNRNNFFVFFLPYRTQR